ncbi:DUF3100 domain-containing protein [Arthrobacter cupressi]|uniref:DUF3100 domain-containing protein n=1 Tax=Arthrobacter cupressi TaxID=1045773 RepID=A0A1G8N678_9MICC|nr:DUF3100 domain-containing protein [Arthrobacter cupressi]NYD78334.1 hypothetical protein [Arthrobacter cupressi]SDI75678.1 Protein of unknown function [Arthrobacter cupressi]
MTSSTLLAAPQRTRGSLAWLWPIGGLALLLATLSQLVGPLVIPVGFAAITILPMVWGILAGGIVSSQKIRPLPRRFQSAAGALMGVSVLILVGSLAFTIGPNIPLLFRAGPALLLQEAGHLLGTLILALPLAVLLKMGPATIGATFSIDREGSFAMVSEKYGTDSHPYRGVLSMYVFGTIFGAVFISLLASVTASLGLFDPLALAMGAGVGSGSMMAAGAASVAAQFPELKDQIFAVAGTSNIITSLLGVYVGIWIALPLADKIYNSLIRRFPHLATASDAVPAAGAATAAAAATAAGATTTTAAAAVPAASAASTAELESAAAESAAAEDASDDATGNRGPVRVPLYIAMPVLTVIGIFIASIAAGGFSWNILGGYLIIDALLLAGLGLSRLCRGKVPSMVFIITLGALASSPVSPFAKALITMVTSVNFLSICTVVLTVAGLSLGKDIPLLRRIGWRIVPVGLVAIASSYLFSVVIAQFTLGLGAH